MILLDTDILIDVSLGILDALIAATALTHNLPLHTFNQKHFAAVPGLQIVHPYQR